MSYTIDSTDGRSIRAIEIAAGASAWIRCRTRDGRHLYGVPSRSRPNLFHLCDGQSCDCPDSQRHPGQACQHQYAVRLHTELVKAQQPKPTRRPVLRMVRESEDVLSWERPARPIPSAAVTAALARKYDRIFGDDEAADIMGRL